MMTAAATVNREGQWERYGLRFIVLSCLLPAAAYFVILILAMVGIRSPAGWLAETLSGSWSVPFLWLVVIGGPLLSSIGTLMLTTTGRPLCRFDRICGWVAVALLFLNLISCVPFPFILAVD